MMSSALSRKRHGFFALLPLLLALLILLSSCKKSATEPAGTLPATDDPGVPVAHATSAVALAWFTDGSEIAFLSSNLGQGGAAAGINAVSLGTNSVRSLYSGPQTYMQLAAAAQHVVFSVMNPVAQSGTFVLSRSPGATPSQVSSGTEFIVSPDGKFVAVRNTPSDSVSVLNLESGTKTTFPIPVGNEIVSFSPDANQILMQSASTGGGTILHLAFGVYTPITTTPYVSSYGPSYYWGASGIRMVLSNQGTYSLVDLTTGHADTLCHFDDRWKNEPPTFSPDGSKVAFLRISPMDDPAGMHTLVVVDVTSKVQTVVVAVRLRPNQPMPGIWGIAFSPDGKKLAYSIEGDIYYRAL